MLRLAGLTALVALLAACGGGQTRQVTTTADEAVMIQKGTYRYDPNKAHPPVSLSGSDLIGLEVRPG